MTKASTRIILVIGVLLSLLAIALLISIGPEAITRLVLANLPETMSQRIAVSLLFLVAAGISLVLVVPSGSLLTYLGGFVLGAALAVSLYMAAVFCVTIILFTTFRSSEYSLTQAETRWQKFALRIQEETQANAYFAALLIRLTPVLPNAVACGIAVLAGVAMKPFLTATILVGWIRPLLLASLGETTRRLMSASIEGRLPSLILEPLTSQSQLGSTALLMLIAFACMVLVFVGRIALKIWQAQQKPL